MNNTGKLFYISGEEILVGDSVKLDDSLGKIVFVIPSNQYSRNYTETSWGYLSEGFGILLEKYGMIHQVFPDEDLIFIKREK